MTTVALDESTTPLPATRNPFASGLFLKWWVASIFAGAAFGVQAVTVPLFIRDRVDGDLRGVAIAAALIAQTLPAALLTLVGGAVADRVERRRILVRAYPLAGIVSLAYVALSGFDIRAIWPVIPLGAVVGSVIAFANPARQSMVPTLVSRAQHQNGVILGAMGFTAATQFLGPMLAGLVTDVHGLTTAFAAEVILLVVAAAVFAGLAVDQPAPTGRNVWADLVEGVRYVRGQPALLGLLAVPVVMSVFVIGPSAVTFVLVVPELLGATDKWIGLLWGCLGIGMMSGSVVLTLLRVPRRGLAICVAQTVCGCLFVLFGLSSSVALTAVQLFLSGLSASVLLSYAIALLQEHTDPRMMGRVMSMYFLAFLAAMPLGHAQAGVMTNLLGLRATLVASGTTAALIGVAFLVLLRPVRVLR